MKSKKPNFKFAPLKTYNVVRVFFVACANPKTFLAMFSLIFAAFKNFFWIQFSRKLKLSKQPIFHVDHALDQKVPFRPEKVKIYLDFIAFWVRPLDMLNLALGGRAATHFVKFLGLIETAYNTAAEFYSRCLTTTNRPKKIANRHFLTIHLFDPHLLCVPSLHIAIVTLTFAYFKKAFADENLPLAVQEEYNKELYEGAVAIAETVLYIKQHSVNCIPAALFMVNFKMPEVFSIQDSVDFIDALFAKSTDILEEDKVKIREHIHFVFEKFLIEGKFAPTWTEPVEKWLTDYKPFVPS